MCHVRLNSERLRNGMRKGRVLCIDDESHILLALNWLPRR